MADVRYTLYIDVRYTKMFDRRKKEVAWSAHSMASLFMSKMRIFWSGGI